MFTKFPELGKCKTRLAKTLGVDKALQIYRALLGYTLSTIKQTPFYKVAVITPDDSMATSGQWAANLDDYWPQGEGDLGQRIFRAIELAFQSGARSVIILGADCPQITPITIKKAFTELEKVDLVLGPSHDGGYYLLGCKKAFPFLFQGIPWSTEDVLKITRNILNLHDLSYILLEKLFDIDTEEDLNQIRNFTSLNNLGID